MHILQRIFDRSINHHHALERNSEKQKAMAPDANSLQVRCPYCEAEFWIPIPTAIEQNPASLPYQEVESLPYVRDIGRFDPEGEQLRGWSRVGEDFLAKLIGWERIGILRVEDKQEIYYQAIRCQQCQYLFDVFANYTKNRSLAAIWPHLLGEDSYVTFTLPFFSRKYTGKKQKKNNYAIRVQPLLPGGAVAILVYICSFIPTIVAHWSPAMKPGGAEQFFREEWPTFLLRGIGAFALFVMMFLSLRLIRFFQEEPKFEDLFRIHPDPQRKRLSYWRRFTLCRMVGVAKPGKVFSPTQVMIIGGVPAALLLLITWAVAHIQMQPGYEAILLGVCLVGGYLIGSSMQMGWVTLVRLLHNQHEKIRPGSLLLPIKEWGVAGVVIGIGVWATIPSGAFSVHQNGYTTVANLVELAFWLIVAYYGGICTWRFAEIPVYVLRGIKQIPLRLQTTRQFKNLALLERMGLLSTAGMLTLFITVMGLLLAETFIPALHSSWWIIIGTQIDFIVLYVLIIIALAGIPKHQLIPIAIIYLLLQLGFGSIQAPGPLTQMFPSLLSHPLGGNLFLYQYCILLLFGFFSSYIFYYQTKEMYGIIQSIRRRYLEEILRFYDSGVQSADEALRQMFKNSWVGSGHMITKSKMLTDTIHGLTTIMDTFESETAKHLLLRRLIAVGSPLISSIILPFLINILSSRI